MMYCQDILKRFWNEVSQDPVKLELTSLLRITVKKY
jgi:hypothetical protein